ncbi:hypothetical protein N8D77_12195 [Curtobacterium flaccumfaciens]|uniref:hypothetical protein n=1 Tax=Curtobacterium TaxID=2034 RepID=UPI000F4A5184|nr:MULTISPECIES: hypothetical protein [Curtobacterium]ROR36412.1 hypothetical protein EDF63_0532 [Curtobacterium sp. JUb34]UXN20914.1 hypothetical protein N8D77_12195 [Curtobacterium flaccumfaciens pv. flaccumfaciens]
MTTREPSPTDPNYDEVQRLIKALRGLGGERAYLLRGLSTLIETLDPIRPHRTTDDDQQAALVKIGAFTEESFAETQRAVDRGELRLAEIKTWLTAARDTRSLRSVARFLHLSEDEVLVEVAKHRLVAVEIGGELRFPTWQLNTRPVGRVLPHLPELIPALEQRWDWISMGGFFTTRQEDLYGEGRKTPAAWLEDGGAPEAVRDIVGSSGRW